MPTNLTVLTFECGLLLKGAGKVSKGLKWCHSILEKIIISLFWGVEIVLKKYLYLGYLALIPIRVAESSFFLQTPTPAKSSIPAPGENEFSIPTPGTQLTPTKIIWPGFFSSN